MSATETKEATMVSIQTQSDEYFFDAILKLDHERSLTITDSPVEEGASITDHSYVNQKRISLNIAMSDVHCSIVAGQFAQRFTRSISAFDTLEEILEEREMVTINTKLAVYENMLLETLSVPHGRFIKFLQH